MRPPSTEPAAGGSPRSRLTEASLDELFRVMASDDAELSEAAWGECYRRYSQKVWSRVFYVVRTIPWLKEPAEVAVDVTSEVFARLPAAVRSYDEMGRAEAWLMRVAVRAALRQKESITGRWTKKGAPGERAQGRVAVDLEDATSRVVTLAETAESEARFELERCLEVWREDPAKERWIAFVELFREGYGHEEIAERLGITPATSRTLLWKIRRELGAMLSPEGGS